MAEPMGLKLGGGSAPLPNLPPGIARAKPALEREPGDA